MDLITRRRKRVARKMRTTTMPGTNSTHVMESGEGKGKFKYQVNPTIFPNEDGTWTDHRESEDRMAAYKEATKRGEVFGFKRKKRAEKFAYGSWKKGKARREAMKNYRNERKTPLRWTRLKGDEKKEFENFRSGLPQNLKLTGKNYDLTGAFKEGIRPEFVEEDKSFHMASRNPGTGKYFKSVKHPTAAHAAREDRKIGYEPIIVREGLKKVLYTGSDSDPAKVKGKVIKKGDEAMKFLEKKEKKYFRKNPNEFHQVFHSKI